MKLSVCAKIIGAEARRQACGNDGPRTSANFELARLLLKHGRSSVEVQMFMNRAPKLDVPRRWMEMVHSYYEAEELRKFRERDAALLRANRVT
jgi:hypothetical protein